MLDKKIQSQRIMVECKGLKKDGEKCSRNVKIGSYCFQHSKPQKTSSIKAIHEKEEIKTKHSIKKETRKKESRKKERESTRAISNKKILQTIHPTKEKNPKKTRIVHGSIVTDFKSNIIPNNVEGPMYATYLKGDIGDGIMRKFLLFGDIHEKPVFKPCRGDSMKLPDFFRFLAESSSVIIDLFLESEFNNEFTTPLEHYEESYLNDVQKAFAACLSGNKQLCNEPMRIHNIDVRDLKGSPLSITTYVRAFGKDPKLLHTNGIRWPSSNEVELAISDSLKDARLGEDKLKYLPDTIKLKFDKLILAMKSKLRRFYRSKKKYHLFQKTIKTYRDLSVSIEDQIKSMINIERRIVRKFLDLLDLYFLNRLFKKTSSRKAERPQYALKEGESITRMVCYLGASHVWNIKDILMKDFGFTLEFEWGAKNLTDTYIQCIPFHEIQYAIQDFVE